MTRGPQYQVILSNVATGEVRRCGFASLDAARRFCKRFRPTCRQRAGWRVEVCHCGPPTKAGGPGVSC